MKGSGLILSSCVGVRFGRRRLVSAQKDALPVTDAIDCVVVGVFGRTADQKAVPDLLLVLVLRPAVARFAERHFVPLAGLVVVACFRKFLAVPYGADAVLEYIAHIGLAYAVEAAHPHAAVMVYR